MTILVMALPLSVSRSPALVLSGEGSVGTWLSGAMLVASGAFSLRLWRARGAWPWSLVAPWFGVLALDERFMFHESLKERVQILLADPRASHLLPEAPVLAGALAGLCAAAVLWRDFRPVDRILLASGTLLGAISVALDVTRSGALPEDLCKLLAELCVLQALWNEDAPVRA